ncbi:MAG: four helix bundle protein [Armatimonadetes bacterium]|nr:four helix bundle protein [Armatimonadota bacterium]
MAQSIVGKKSFKFALDVIKLYIKLREQREYVISKQLLRSGTSIGANIEEATSGQSRRDFLSKMSIATKEARETSYWLKLLQESDLTDLNVKDELAAAEELICMLVSIVKTVQENPDMPVGQAQAQLKTQNSELRTQK